MKTLYLIRHAKASIDNHKERDMDRPLLQKGFKRTRYILDFLNNKHTSVDQIISSPAKRAYETAHIFAHALHFPTENIKIERSVYNGDAEKLADLFYDLSRNIDKLMIVGHNPSITNFANSLLPEPIDYLPTSGLVCIEFDTNLWDTIWQAKILTNFVVTPRMLMDDNED